MTGGGAKNAVGDDALLGGESMSTVTVPSTSPTRRGLPLLRAAEGGRPDMDGLVTRVKDARFGDAIPPKPHPATSDE